MKVGGIEMVPEAIKEFYIQNGDIKVTNDEEIFKNIEKPPIYEVIRVIKGVPLFLEEHLDRMFHSAKITGYELCRDEKEIREDIKKLILNNNVEELNVKLLSSEVEGIGKVFLAYCINSFYPPQEYYDNGIKTILFYYERQNPNAKVLFTSFKEEVTKELKDRDAFEALLVGETGYIPEGSRSNMFFVQGNKIYTAPESEVLLGVTRKQILEICQELKIEVIEKSIHKDEINRIDGAFMSGTSVNVLPISTVDNMKISSMNDESIIKINMAYSKKMSEYIELHKVEWI